MSPRDVGLWGPVLLVAGGIFTLSHMSSPPSPTGVPDWLLHGMEFALLGLLLARALAGGWRGRLRFRRALAAMVLGLLYGAADEWHQSFIPGRQAAAADWLADGAGTLLGVALAAAMPRFGTLAGQNRGRTIP